MSNWSLPTVDSNYTSVITEIKNRDLDLAKGLDPATTAGPSVETAGMIRWNSVNNHWQKYSGTAWGVLSTAYAISISGNAATATTATSSTTASTATNSTNAANIFITNDTTTNASKYLTWVDNNTGNTGQKVTSTKLTFNPFTGRLSSTEFAGNLIGNVTGTATTATTATNATNATNVTGGSVTATTIIASADSQFTSTGAVKVPQGTTVQRPGTPLAGMIRYNATVGQFEGYGSAWGTIGGGATGAGGDQVFYENSLTISTNYTITTNKSAMSTGPITIATGVSVTIPSGGRWVIL